MLLVPPLLQYQLSSQAPSPTPSPSPRTHRRYNQYIMINRRLSTRSFKHPSWQAIASLLFLPRIFNCISPCMQHNLPQRHDPGLLSTLIHSCAMNPSVLIAYLNFLRNFCPAFTASESVLLNDEYIAKAHVVKHAQYLSPLYSSISFYYPVTS
jgi:hypothetical protein